MKGNIAVKLNNTSAQALKTELLKYPNIKNVAAASHIPSAGTTYGNGFKKELTEKEWTSLDYFVADEDYLKNMDVNVVAGKYFSLENGESNKNFIVINEQAVKAFHYKNPADALGEQVIY